MASYSRRRKKSGNSRLKFLMIATVLVCTAAFFMFKEDKKKKDVETAKLEKETAKVELQKEEEMKIDSLNKICTDANLAFEQGNLVESRDLAMKIVLDEAVYEKSKEVWLKASEILNKSNMKILNENYIVKGKTVRYSVKSGDALSRIAKKFGTTVEAIKRSNKLNKNNIFPNQTLHIYQAKWNIKISRKKYLLYLYDGEDIFKIYHIGLGRLNKTPTGGFKIKNRIKNPIWYPPNGDPVILNDNPKNPLGSRWMALEGIDSETEGLKGFGIHGTINPESIGKNESNGCIRMVNKDVEELFSLMTLGTKVTIE